MLYYYCKKYSNVLSVALAAFHFKPLLSLKRILFEFCHRLLQGFIGARAITYDMCLHNNEIMITSTSSTNILYEHTITKIIARHLYLCQDKKLGLLLP